MNRHIDYGTFGGVYEIVVTLPRVYNSNLEVNQLMHSNTSHRLGSKMTNSCMQFNSIYLSACNALLKHSVYLLSHGLASFLEGLKVDIRDLHLNILLKVENVGFIGPYFLL